MKVIPDTCRVHYIRDIYVVIMTVKASDWDRVLSALPPYIVIMLVVLSWYEKVMLSEVCMTVANITWFI